MYFYTLGYHDLLGEETEEPGVNGRFSPVKTSWLKIVVLKVQYDNFFTRFLE